MTPVLKPLVCCGFTPCLQRIIEYAHLEKGIVNVIKEKAKIGIDELAINLEQSMSELSTALLMMEFNGVVRQLPGKFYEIA